MTAHTPGPWHAFWATGEHSGWHIAPSGYAVAPIAHVGLPNAIPEKFEEANARLISAAPDLLEALQDLYDLVTDRRLAAPLDAYGVIDVERLAAADLTLSQARRTLAKATDDQNTGTARTGYRRGADGFAHKDTT